MTSPPTMHTESALLRAGASRIAGMDEVGRGAIAGPVLVGVVVVDQSVGDPPEGLRDSKLLSPRRREQLVPLVRRWCLASAVGASSATEVDALGIMGALRLAGLRALDEVGRVDHLLLDGNHNWLHPGDPLRLALEVAPPDPPAGSGRVISGRSHPQMPDPAGSTGSEVPPVTTVIGGDRSGATMAAASVLAKVTRDAAMAELATEFPGYHWQRNKGYGTREHLDAIRAHGASPLHRTTWRLPVRNPDP